MKFTVEGFNQKKLVDFNLDIVDAAILRYFIDFKDSGSMVSKLDNEKQYYWVKYEGIIEALPILKLNKADSVYRRLKKMVEQNILESITVKHGGVFSYYKTGVNYYMLIDDRAIISTDINPECSDENPKVTDINPNHSDINPEQNINLLYSSNNNSSINIYTLVIDYLNKVAGTSYKASSKKTQSLIKARVNEGFTLDHFKVVIDKKYKEWINTEWARYIRPETLFGNKFEEYYNQLKSVSTIKNNSNSNGKHSTFNAHTQRSYDGSDGGPDMNELERRLLGWDKEDE